MTRALLWLSVVSMLPACAGSLKSIERGKWVLVNADDGKGQEIITDDSYNNEVVGGRERKVKMALDEKGPVLHDAESPLTLKVGEVLRFRINEGVTVDFQSDERVTESFWTESHRVDGWNGDQAVEGRESYLYLRGTKAGTGKLKLIDSTWGTHEYEVLVTEPSGG